MDVGDDDPVPETSSIWDNGGRFSYLGGSSMSSSSSSFGTASATSV